MQLVPTAEQWNVIDKVVRYVLFPALGWFFKSLVHNLRDNLNTVVTNNANRIRDDLATHINETITDQEISTHAYIDTKFRQHEDSAFSRITALEKSVAVVSRLLNEIKLEREIIKQRGAGN